MLILYNLAQILAVTLLFPVIVGYVVIKAKYRTHILRRLGMGLQTLLSSSRQPKKTIWIHALSVGEVTSALPLVSRMRQEFKYCRIIFSSSTSSGLTLSRRILAPYCDAVIASPLDIFPVCKHFIRKIKPDLFVLVETDFWPNLLLHLHRESVTTLLVNARLSTKSMSRYSRYSMFFDPLFKTFQAVCTQTEQDREKFIALGVPKELTYTLGNLKFEPFSHERPNVADRLLAHVDTPLFLAGSTHPGEEEVLLDVYINLRKKFDFRLILAPRDPARSREVEAIALKRGLNVQLRSADLSFNGDVFIVDTIGELIDFYKHSYICLVGGSFVKQGGHNPLEPASQGKPVLFGPDMSDFSEISRELVDCGGAFQVSTAEELKDTLTTLLSDKELHASTGDRALSCVSANRGVVEKHLKLIKEFV